MATMVWFSLLGGWNAVLTEKLDACMEVNRGLEIACSQHFNTSWIPKP
jgi:hypothetical protein